jgi:hypothetical protein
MRSERLPEASTEIAGIAAACGVRLRVDAAGRHLGFATDGERIAAWPLRYLAPVCSFAPADAELEPSVTVVADDARHAAVRAAAQAAGEARATVTYEDEPVDRHRMADGVVALVYRERPGVTLVDRALGVLAFVTTAEDPQAPFEAARLIREVLRRRLEHEGWAVLHAGAVSFGGSIWIVCGPKFAGKTTLVCALIEHLGADFVSNDRVFLGAGAGWAEVVSWPMSVRIGLGTCLASPPLRGWLRPGRSPEYPQFGWDQGEGLDEEEARRLAARPGAPKLELVPAELVASLGGRVAAGGHLGGILLPARDPSLAATAGRAQEVGPETARKRLLAELLTPDDDDYPDWLGLRHPEEAAEQRHGARGLVDLAVDTCPVVKVEFSTGEGAVRGVREANLALGPRG